MNDVDELPSWAGRALQTGSVTPPTAEPPGRKGGGGTGRNLLIGLLGLLLLGAIGGIAFWASTQMSDDEVATDAATDAEENVTGDDAETSEAVTTDEPASPTTDTTTTDTSTPTETTDEDDADPASDPAAGESDGVLALPEGYEATDPNFDERVAANTRYTVLKGGQVFLYGYVPTAELGEQIIAVAGGVVGPDNVFSEQIVDPDTPDIDDAPVFIDDRVLFGFNSVAIEPVFEPILDLGVLLMSQNPTATVTVVSRTDAVGSEAINQEVSEQRAQAVVDYWAAKGIAPDRVVIDARGESDASDDDDDQTAALNRSVEFRIANLFPEQG